MRIRLLITSFLLSIAYFSSYATISLSEAEQIAKDYIRNEIGSNKIDIYKSQSIMSKIEIYYEKDVILKDPSWCFLIDLKPNAGWSHECIILCVSSINGDLKQIKKTMPPIGWKKWKKINEKETLRSYNYITHLVPYNLFPSSGIRNDNAYAVLIDGGCSPEMHSPSHWNDCSVTYQALTSSLGYKEENIYVLMSDGPDNQNSDSLDLCIGNNTFISAPLDLDGKGRKKDVQYKATSANVDLVFSKLSKKLTNKNDLFVFVTNHGNVNFFSLWHDLYSSDQLSTQLDKINAKSITVVFVQCYGGSFIDELKGENRTIISEASKNEFAWFTYNSMFIRPFMSAISGYNCDKVIDKPQDINAKINADADNDGVVSYEEAFAYGVTYDTQAKAAVIDSSWHETPQFWTDKAFFKTNIDTGTGCLMSNSTITATNVLTNTNIQYKSENKILLKKGFKTQNSKFKGIVSSDYLKSLRIDENTEFDEENEEDFDDSTTDELTLNSENSEVISIFPNPTTGVFNVIFGEESVENSIVITDIPGKVVLSKTNVGSEIEVDLTDNAKGVYFVRLTSDGKTIVKQVVLM